MKSRSFYGEFAIEDYGISLTNEEYVIGFPSAAPSLMQRTEFQKWVLSRAMLHVFPRMLAGCTDLQ